MDKSDKVSEFDFLLNQLIEKKLAPLQAEISALREQIQSCGPQQEKLADTEWVTVTTAAKAVRRSSSWVYKMERLGRLIPQEGSTGTKLYLMADIRALCEKPKPLGIPAAKRTWPGMSRRKASF